MGVDPLSPIAPARIRGLLLPVGRIKRSSFMTFVELMQKEATVRLGDISPDSRPNRTMFSPMAFPNGVLLYDLTISEPPPSHLSLSPFELFREPLAIIGIADWLEYQTNSSPNECDAPGRRNDAQSSQLNDVDDGGELRGVLNSLRDQYPKALVHQLVLFNFSGSASMPWLPEDTLYVPPVAQFKTTTMKTVLCDLSASLLAEMTTLARSLQALFTIPSPTVPQASAGVDGAIQWPSEQSGPIARRNSQMAGGSRSNSPASALSNGYSQNRMSMPTQLPSSSSTPSFQDSRPGSPGSGSDIAPARTFEEIARISREAPRSTTPTGTINHSREVSLQGFGSGGAGERARYKGKCRIGIVIGTMYLLAGRWQDALRELIENALQARSLSDHLWHAKGLETIMVCLFMFSWAGMDFQIPQICYPTGDKASATKSSSHTPSNSIGDVTTGNLTKPTNHSVAMQNLNALIPDLVNMILSIYARAANFAGEALPPLAFSEVVMRFSKLLAVINIAGGSLTSDALNHIFQGQSLPPTPDLYIPRTSIRPRRNEIANLLFRAMPGPSATGLTTIDHVMILAGIASILSLLGLQRKKAMILKEVIMALTPGLVQARKAGAAEMGVHPAAGLAALTLASGSAPSMDADDTDNGLEEFLGLLGRIYGVLNVKKSSQNFEPPQLKPINGDTKRTSATLTPSPIDGAMAEKILKNAFLRSFGSLSLKLDILRICINLCEALPDFQGVLDFSAALLATAGPGTAPSSNSTDVYVSLSREEQVRLATNISRTVSAARKLGLPEIETEYWDDFLVRGVYVVEASQTRLLTEHRDSELKPSTKTKDPFIHNPFNKQSEATITENLIVTGEAYDFIVSVQNPYDFDVEIEYMKLANEGPSLTSSERNLLLGPYRTQKFTISGVAKGAGTARINGVTLKIRGCRERTFSIFSDPWKPEKEFKVKTIGLSALRNSPGSRPVSDTSVFPQDKQQPLPSFPTPVVVPLTVIPEQPIVVVTKVSLPQSALMVLEGEQRIFTITLQNLSRSTPVDFLHVTFQDSSTSALQEALSNKDLSPSELHEIEWQLSSNPAIRWVRSGADEQTIIPPDGTATFEIEITGKPGLNDGIVHFDYANLGIPHSEVRGRFFTRQVSVPVTVTVNASVQLHRIDIIPFSPDFSWANCHRLSTSSASSDGRHRNPESSISQRSENCFKPLLNRIGWGSSPSEHYLLLMDLRNAWPSPLSISIEVLNHPGTALSSGDGSWQRAYTLHEVIQPGHVSRLVLILPKLFIADPHAPIPSINHANQRQFVVSSSKVSPDTERANREAFWYREELLKCLRGTWREEDSRREGNLELRTMRLNPKMIDSMKEEDVDIQMRILTEVDGSIHQVGRSKFEVPVEEFLVHRTTLRNRTRNPIAPILRLQPSMANMPHGVALDLEKRISWSGLLQKPLPVLKPGESVSSDVGIVVLCPGVFEVAAMVEEVRLREDDEMGEGRVRSDTELLRESLLGKMRRRVWYGKEGCVIVGREVVEG